MARPAIFDKPMTVAERKRRSRAILMGEVRSNLAMAVKECAEWQRCMKSGGAAVTQADIAAAFEQISLLIATAELSLPQG